MADVRPFRGIHYNRSLLSDWAKVICPVYDIIPQSQHEQLYGLSPYNFVRLEAGRELPQDSVSDNRYTRAAATLKDWLHSGILETDRLPAFYMHDHYFAYEGSLHKRRALIARVHLEEWDRMVIRPHESTFAEAKSDRLSLLWAIEANTSSILSLYQDQQGLIRSLLDQQASNIPPTLDLQVENGEGHKVWQLADPQVTGRISEAMRGLPLYIADGHHRYESALAYSKQKRAATQSTREEPFDFVMMTLVEFDDPGLLILPPHRLVRGISRPVLEGLRERLGALFDITTMSLSQPNIREKVDAMRKSVDKPRLVLLGLQKDALLILEPKDMEALAPMMPYFHTDLYRRLEVSIIDHVILEKLLGISHDKEKVGYSHQLQECMDRVAEGEYQLAFLLEPIKAETIRGIADLGDKMPKKSTYFYPKVPAGLIVNGLA